MTKRARTAREELDLHVSEASLFASVTEYARRNGWRWWHDNDPVRNAAGFPDLLLVRDRVVWAELKSQRGYETPAQKAFRARLEEAGAECYVWRPSDWSSGCIEATLA